MIKAIIFDVDGTMVDSEPLHVDAWDKALQLYNFSLKDLSQALLDNMAGRKPIAIADDMVEELRLKMDGEILLKQKTEIFMEIVETDLQGMPGLKKALDDIQAEGYRLAIGTSQVDPYIGLVLDTLRVRDYFEVIVTGAEITQSKPHPQTYMRVAEKLGLSPRECVVIEDAASGVASAKAAGCHCLAITNPHPVPQDLSQSDTIIASLSEIKQNIPLP